MRHKIRHAIFAVLIGFSSATAAAAKKEPLTDHVALFNEMDANLRTADPSINASNHVIWVEAAIQAKQKLHLRKEIDPWMKELSTACSNDWRVLRAAAVGYNEMHKWDRESTALDARLMDQAYQLAVENKADAEELSRLIDDYIACLIGEYNTPRRLQLKISDIPPSNIEATLNTLWPDQDDEIEPPVFHSTPASYESAANDGELIRWLLANKPITGYETHGTSRDWTMSDFAVMVVGAQIDMPHAYSGGDHPAYEIWRTKIDKTLTHLDDDQSVVWGGSEGDHLVVDLPQYYRYIDAYKARAKAGDLEATKMLGTIFFNRRQLDRAITWYERAGCTNEVKAIRDNQGTFLRHQPSLAGDAQRITYYHRNGDSAEMSIHPINLGSNFPSRLIAEEVMGSEKKLLRGEDRYFNDFNIADREGVIGPAITNWTVALAVKPNHVSTKTDINIPALEAGFYLLRADMRDGNRSEIVSRVYDTMLINTKEIYLLCDARTGAPLPNEPIDFFLTSEGIKEVEREGSYRTDYVDEPVNVQKHERFNTDAAGILITNRDIAKKKNLIYARGHLLDQDTVRLSASGQYEDKGWNGEPKPFLTTDRPVYRPGDTGHLKYWTPQANATVPKKLEVLHDERGESLPLVSTAITDGNGALRVDEFGGADFSFAIPSNAPLGHYEVREDKNDWISRLSFSVEDYRAPEIQLDAAFNTEGKIELTVNHFYGATLSGASIKGNAWFESAVPNVYHPSAPMDKAWGKGYWWNGDQFTHPDDLLHYENKIDCKVKFNSTLDAHGQLIIDPSIATNGPAAIAAPGVFAVSGLIYDAAGREHEVWRKVPTPATIGPKLCVWLNKAFYSTSDSMACHIAAAPSVSLSHIEIRDWNGQIIQTLSIEKQDKIMLKPLAPGIYEAVLISRDHQASRPFQFVVGDATNTGLTKENPIRLILEKGVYKVGDTARVMIQVDQPGRFVYLFSSVSGQSGFEKPRVFEMDKTSRGVEINLDDELLHNGVIRCAALTVFDGKSTLVNRLIHVGTTDLDAGSISLTPDKEIYSPRENVSLAIQTLASDGAPRTSSVTVTVYNEALDLWKPWYSPDLVKALFSSMRNCSGEKLSMSEVFTRPLYAKYPRWVMESLISQGLAPFHTFLEMSVAYGGLGGAGGYEKSISEEPPFEESSAPPSLRIREDFRDLAYWNATVQTDSNGCANVTFPMPDGLVKWKIKAWATHTNYAATATTSIECAKEFVAHLNTPRFMREGDEIALSTAVRNHATNTLPHIAATISVKGVELESAANSKIVNLQPGAETNVYWNLHATEPGTAKITTKAWNDSTSDGMKKTFPILPRGMLKRGGRGGVLAGEKTSETITIEIPAEIDPNSLDCQLNVTPNMIDALANALPFLSEYPHGCAEQTLSQFLCSLMVLNTMEELEISTLFSTNHVESPKQTALLEREEVIEQARVGLRMLTDPFDHYHPQWGWNLDRHSPRDPFITAWVLRGLRITEEVSGLTVERSVLKNAGKHILSEMNRCLDSPPNATNAPAFSNINALQALVISEFGKEKVRRRYRAIASDEHRKTLAGYSNLLLANADQLSLYGKVLLALAFENQGDTESRDKLIAYIDQYLERDAETGAAWLRTGATEYWYWYNDDIETQAWYLKLLNRVDPQGERAAGIARHLMLNRVHGDHWKSTRDTAIAVEALAEFAKNNQPKPGDTKPEITLNGTRLNDPADARLAPGVNTLTLTSPSGTPLFHDVTWSYYSKENPITAETCELVTIDRKYFRPADNEEGRVAIEPGEAIAIGERIEVELTLHASQHLEYLLAEDFKPAGVETIDQESGYWGGAYRELHDERVSFYLHSVRKGETHLSYEIRAEFAGTLSAHPATIELMYEPRQAANSHERTFLIER